ncbi:MAG: NTP transferase domain-containing protein [Acidimicrobiales bacterium]
MTVAAIVLAAGAGSRFRGGTHKLLARLGGRPLVAHAVGAAVASGLEVFVVTGAVELRGRVDPEAILVHNPRWSEGQASSLQAGIAAAAAAGHDAVVVGLGDQPLVGPHAWSALAACPASMAVATYGGRLGNPVRLGAEVWPHLPSIGDQDTTSGVWERSDLVVRVPCAGDPADVDTVEDLERWG